MSKRRRRFRQPFSERVTFGDFYLPGRDYLLHSRFLTKLASIPDPHVVERLERDVFATFETLSPSTRSSIKREELREKAPSLWDSIEAWLQRFNLNCDWMREVVFETLKLWEQDKTKRGRIFARLQVSRFPLPTGRSLQFHPADFDRSLETKEKIRDYLVRRAEKVIDSCLEEGERLALMKGWKPIPSLEADLDKHIEWLVLDQLGYSQKDIAQQYGFTRNHILNSVVEARDLLSLPSPARKRIGRPRKK